MPDLNNVGVSSEPIEHHATQRPPSLLKQHIHNLLCLFWATKSIYSLLFHTIHSSYLANRRGLTLGSPSIRLACFYHSTFQLGNTNPLTFRPCLHNYETRPSVALFENSRAGTSDENGMDKADTTHSWLLRAGPQHCTDSRGRAPSLRIQTFSGHTASTFSVNWMHLKL
jgi:hypothetical protein